MGYTLVICEKPDAARRVSEALSDGRAAVLWAEGTAAYKFRRGEEEYVVCSAQGHAYGVADPVDERTVYPVFDVEWYPNDAIDPNEKSTAKRIRAIRKLSVEATKFVNACDFDVEGETIGYNILKYACAGKEQRALRVKFSTLTKEDLVRAFSEASPQEGEGLALAGRTRHALDFVWGVNLSRSLSLAARKPGQKYRTISIGRVQGPTLGFLASREREIRSFVPVPSWNVSAEFSAGGRRFWAEYVKSPVDTRQEATEVVDGCRGKGGIVTRLSKKAFVAAPPPPFNIGDLQKEAYRVLRLSPSRTMKIAERLYLSALISYPRTGSQRLPPSLGYEGLLQRIGQMSEYSELADELLRSKPRPVQGPQDDKAHPAIHPTGEKPKRRLERSEASVFDLVVRRFLAAFGPSARRESVDGRIAVGDYEFRLSGLKTVSPGWMKFYGRYSGAKEVDFPKLSEGERLKVVGTEAEERFAQGPRRFNQATLLQKMEDEKIGTKATRADTIATLANRGYVDGDQMAVTDLGISVLEVLEEHAPSVTTVALTRSIEGRLEGLERTAEGEAALLREAVRSISDQLSTLNAVETQVGGRIGSAASNAPALLLELGSCPVCKAGKLRIVTSRKSGKRFVGCSNYPSGCRASAPLPQRGTVKPTPEPCRECGWPVILVISRRPTWSTCVNVSCPTKGGRKI